MRLLERLFSKSKPEPLPLIAKEIVYNFFKDNYLSRGNGWQVKQIVYALKMPDSTVRKALDDLVKDGKIRRHLTVYGNLKTYWLVFDEASK